MTHLSHVRDLDLLARLIDRSGWSTSRKALAEATPHLTQALSPDDILATLRNLDLPVQTGTARMSDIAQADCPCLFFARDGSVRLVLDRRADGLGVYEPAQDRVVHLPAKHVSGGLLRLSARSGGVAQPAPPERIGRILSALAPMLAPLLLVSLVSNLFALAVPVTIMVLYDRAIPAGSHSMIVALALGLGAIFVADVILRALRARALAFAGAYTEHRLSLALFRKLCRLKTAELEKNGVEAQLSRLKQFESLRDAFSGPVASVLLDLPFTLLFVAAIFLISAPVGWLVVGAVAGFALLAMATQPQQKRLNSEAVRRRTDQQLLLHETIAQQRALSRLGLEDVWAARHAECSAEVAVAQRDSKRLQTRAQAIGQAIMTFAGVGAIVLGTTMAIDGALSFGGLIAIMALIWKALSPVQALFSARPQISGFLQSARQIDRVLALPEVFTRGGGKSAFDDIEAEIRLDGVSHRFPSSPDYVLTQVGLTFDAGRATVISGANGSGKSVLLDLIDGLHEPTVGTLSLGGIHYGQIAREDLHETISYARHTPDFFHGTIAQNMRLAAPLATDAEIWRVLEQLGLKDDIAALESGLETRMTEAFRSESRRAMLRGLNLARALVKPARILLLDGPSDGLDTEARARLCETLRRLDGTCTVVMASNDPAMIALADRCVFLSQGRVVANDTGIEAKRKIAALLQKSRN